MRKGRRMQQYDIFGEIREPPEKPKISRKFKTMQEQYGTYESETCKTCGHRKCIRYDRIYHKCELWHLSHSAATDIRLKDTACKKWIPRGEVE
jgi:hypothetical protein